MNDCVFCGQPIQPDQPTAGRPPMAAHATCADAALADDGHWDAVAAASPLDAEDEPSDPPPVRSAGRAGCVTLSVLAIVAAVAVVVPALSTLA